MRPRVPHSWMRWKGTDWVETVKSRNRPSPKSTSPLVVRSVSQGRIAVHQGHRPARLGPEEEPPRHHRVAADVVERPAADVRLVADVAGVVVEVGEEHLQGAQRPDPPGPDQLPGVLPLRVEAHHERLRHVHLALAELGGLFGGEGDGLLAQHVLPGPGRLQGERDVEVVGERDVDGLDLGVGQELLVGTVGPGDGQLAGRLLGVGQGAGGDGAHLDVRAALHGGDDLQHPDLGGAEHPPDDLLHGGTPRARGPAAGVPPNGEHVKCLGVFHLRAQATSSRDRSGGYGAARTRPGAPCPSRSATSSGGVARTLQFRPGESLEPLEASRPAVAVRRRDDPSTSERENHGRPNHHQSRRRAWPTRRPP